MTDVSDEELGAYLDGELPPGRRSAVAAFLAASPEQERRLEAYRADGNAIARLFANADRPGELSQPVRHESRKAGGSMPWRRAAVLAFLVAGAVASSIWLYAPSGRSDELRRFGQLAAAAYSAQPASLILSLDEVSRLISSSLPAPVAFRDPSGSGFQLIGSRAISTGGAAQVQLVLRNQTGATVTMFLEARPGAPDTSFIAVPNASAHTTLVWVDDEIACAVSGMLSPDQLESAARLIYRHLLS